MLASNTSLWSLEGGICYKVLVVSQEIQGQECSWAQILGWLHPHPKSPFCSFLWTSASFFSPTANTANVFQLGVQASRVTNLTFIDLGSDFQHNFLIVQLRLDAYHGPNLKVGSGEESSELGSALYSQDHHGSPLNQGLGSDGGRQMGLFLAKGAATQTTHWELFTCFEWGWA